MADTIVLVDDESEVLGVQADALRGRGAVIHKFTDPFAAWEFLRRERTTLVVTDWNMPGMSGMDLLFRIRGLPFPPYVIVLTAFGTLERAVKAMNAGAYNFLAKPIDIGPYQSAIEAALVAFAAQAATAVVPLPRASKRVTEPIAVSPAMRQVCEMARAAASRESSVLVLGESGTGKEVLADYIHQHSHRSTGPLVKVNCGALPEHLMESELFGHEKGAFTGADRKTVGRFEQASGGTLFLDEIGDLLPQLQVKLLRALQDRKIERVGSSVPVSVDFRLVCATHRDLKAAVAAERFREDLYYRINVVPVRIPPLRERQEDIEPLAMHFLSTLRADDPKAPEAFSAETIAALRMFPWPGNVRQLRNAIEYALVVCQDTVITPADLPDDLRHQSPVTAGAATEGTAPTGAAEPTPPAMPHEGLKGSLETAEADAIRAALIRNRWQVSKAARELKVSRSVLYARMNAYGIKRPV
jgi:DNA-binding NtrC family response regulator